MKEVMTMTIKDLIEHLKTYPFDMEVAHILWLPEDAVMRAEQRGYAITDEEANDVISSMQHHADCSIGMSWDSLDAELDDYMDDDHKIELIESYLKEVMKDA